MFYVYAYCNKKKLFNDPFLRSQPFYIGKGSGRRINDHKRDALNDKCGPKLSHIRTLIKDDALEIVKLKDSLTQQEAFDFETELILHYGRKDLKTGCLLNNTPGGDGPRHPPETYKRIGDKLRGRQLRPETIKKISDSLKGKSRPENIRSKISNTLTGVKHDKIRRENIVQGMQESILKQRKKWLITSPETSYCIVSLDYLHEAGIGSLYRTVQTRKPITRGKLKGWQLHQIVAS